MNKFIAMIILKPDIKEKRVNKVQNSILNMFEQNTKVHRIWYLGKQKLDFNTKRYNEGIYLKINLTAKPKKIEYIRQELRKNQDIISTIIMIMIVKKIIDYQYLKFKNYHLIKICL